MRLAICLISLFSSLLLALFSSLGAAASTDDKQVTVAVISFDSQFLEAQRGMKEKLSQFGFHEEKNIHYLTYDLKKNLFTIPDLISRLQEQKCDLIMTITTPVTLAVKKALPKTVPIPVVFTMVADPIRSGIVPSLKSPGGNFTGITYNAFSMMPKRLELFREAFPQIKKIAIFYNYGEAWISDPVRKMFMPAARDLGFQIIAYDVRSREDMTRSIQNFDSDTEGIFMLPDPLSISFYDDFLSLSRQYNLPIMVQDNALLAKGGILGYSPSFLSIGRQAASMINKILSGIPPGKIAIQNPDSIQLRVSIREANLLRIHLSESFLRQADLILR